MKTVTALTVRQSLGRVLDQLEKTGEPIIVAKDRKARAVLITLADFERVALDPDLAEEAERLARERRLTGSDAVYAALAQTTGASWCTLDRSAHERVAELSISRLITA